jgi:hypothetical protein
VDGHLTEQVWKEARWATGFLQRDPQEGQPASRRTWVAFLYDDEALYVGARMECPEGEAIRATVSRRDEAGNSERILVSLDTYHDRRTAYTFGVTASGVRLDYYHPDDEQWSRDYSFDPVWEARVARDSLGWTAEMRIPFTQLRFSRAREQVWGLNINRWVPTTNEDLYWVLVPKEETGWASRFGELVGIRDLPHPRRLEIYPYLASNNRIEPGLEGDPFGRDRETRLRGGADLKMGLGPHLTLEATVNPDFGQVEADPAEVNLTAFETFFQEKRPFFVEGSRLLRGGGRGYFYSRRIGAPPHYTPPADAVDMPENTTILGAVKLTGRTDRGLSVGALAALTDAEHARTYDAATGQRGRVLVEPRAGYGVVRLLQEFGRDASTAGFVLTGVARDIPPGSPLAGLLVDEALTGGADLRLRKDGGAYEVFAALGFSHLRGAPEALARIQTSSAHYFQRPDAAHVTLDSTRTTLSGYAFELGMERNAGRHWLWEFGLSGQSPGFELNDIGQLRIADEVEAWGELVYRETRPRGPFQSYRLRLRTEGSWNFGGVRTGTSFNLVTQATWRNFSYTWLAFGGAPRALDDRATRGGPLMGREAAWGFEVGMGNSWASNRKWQVSLNHVRDAWGGWSLSSRLELRWRSGGRTEVSVEPFLYTSLDKRQYVGRYETARQATYGYRYVFATLDRTTLGLQLRCNYALSPDLTLELYAEPFAANGRYSAFGELPAPRSYDLRRYGTDGTTIERDPWDGYFVVDGDESFLLPYPDFRYLSFRSNLVLRWEFQPGSVLYVVWQQDRSDYVGEAEAVSPGSWWDSLGAQGAHFLAVKVTYYLPAG